MIAEHLRHQQAGRRLGAQAEVHEGQHELGVGGRVDQIAVMTVFSAVVFMTDSYLI